MTDKTIEELKDEWVAAKAAYEAALDAYHAALKAQEKTDD
jgi:hypothetical protein